MKRIIDQIFPTNYHFYEKLDQQAKINASAIDALCKWLGGGSESEGERLLQYVNEANEVRMLLEKDLVEAFTTPFDRVDIYSISVSMNEVLQYARSTLLSMKAFDVKPDNIIIEMCAQLKEGVDIFSAAVKSLKEDPAGSAKDISGMRETHTKIEQYYRDGMAAVFQTNDPIFALKQREVYHHIKDASSNLEESVDILHRIIVRLT